MNVQDIFSHTFAFQQAVEKLPDRKARDLRILVRNYDLMDENLKALGEEFCMCNFDTFGCIATFSIEVPTDWAIHKSHFAHVVAHTIGASTQHDDEIYLWNPNEKLIMWKPIGNVATLWSPEVKSGINSHDNSCLKEEKSKSK